MQQHWIEWSAVTLVGGALVFGLTGCSRSAPGPGGQAHHGHDTENEAAKTVQITVFGERHELFVEHRLVVAGHPTTFVTHVTEVETLQPRRTGPLRFALQLGQEHPLAHTEEAPTRPGIYEATLTFPKAGDWTVTVTVPQDTGEKPLALGPVRVFASPQEAQAAPASDAPEGITFLKEQQWKVLLGTAAVGKRRLVEHLRLPATVVVRPGSLAQVTSPVPGRLLTPPAKPMPVVGEKVVAGQTLAVIAPSFSESGARLVEVEGEVARARLAVEQAELALRRMGKLARAEAKSARELEEAEFALKTAQARHAAAGALRSTYQSTGADVPDGSEARLITPPTLALQSPINGTLVAQLGAAVGELIPPDKSVFTVLDAGTVFLEGRVPEDQVSRLGSAAGARYEAPGERGRFMVITEHGQGRLVFLGLQVDQATRTVPLVYEVNNSEGRLRVGQAVNLLVETARAEDTLAIPDSAVVEEDGRPIAFVQVGGETFQKRDLTVGLRDGNWVQVLSGVTAGERIVTQGAYAVRLASVSSVIPAHGHVH
jgi:RND family efflux transporter MFP subunit